MWTEADNRLSCTFQFTNFIAAFSFMTEIAFHAEQQNHHPNWSNVYNRVVIELNTHDAGGIVTDKDRKLAETIDRIFKKFN